MDSENLFCVDYIKMFGCRFQCATIAQRFNTSFILPDGPVIFSRCCCGFFFMWPSSIFHGYYSNSFSPSAFVHSTFAWFPFHSSPRSESNAWFRSTIHLKGNGNSSSSDIDINMLQASLTNVHINNPHKRPANEKPKNIQPFLNCSRFECINLMFTVTMHCRCVKWVYNSTVLCAFCFVRPNARWTKTNETRLRRSFGIFA